MIDDYHDVFKDELEQLPGEAHFITVPFVTPMVSHVRRIPVSPVRRIPVSLTYRKSEK